jgi:hypothetical protein
MNINTTELKEIAERIEKEDCADFINIYENGEIAWLTFNDKDAIYSKSIVKMQQIRRSKDALIRNLEFIKKEIAIS